MSPSSLRRAACPGTQSGNADFDSRTPFAAILVGQPTVSRRLRMGAFSAVDQRIATRFTLTPMDPGESLSYLRHHLISLAAPIRSSRMTPSPGCTVRPTVRRVT